MSERISTGYSGYKTYSWTRYDYLNQIACPITIPEPGTIDRLTVYWAGNGGSTSGYHAIWHPNGGILAQSSRVTAGPGSRAGDSQNWVRGYFDPPVQVEAGTYWIGLWGEPDRERIYGRTEGNGTIYRRTRTDGIDDFTNHYNNQTSDLLRAYCRFTPGAQLNVRSGGSWIKGRVHVYGNGGWQPAKGVHEFWGDIWRRKG